MSPGVVIVLEPLFHQFSLSGTLPDARFGSLHREPFRFTTHHEGPVGMIFHAGCPTQSTVGPLLIEIFPARDSSHFVAAAEFGQFEPDLRRDVVLPPGDYTAQFILFNQTRGGCPWTMGIEYPF